MIRIADSRGAGLIEDESSWFFISYYQSGKTPSRVLRRLVNWVCSSVIMLALKIQLKQKGISARDKSQIKCSPGRAVVQGL